jgi:hypothetical protein
VLEEEEIVVVEVVVIEEEAVAALEVTAEEEDDTKVVAGVPQLVRNVFVVVVCAQDQNELIFLIVCLFHSRRWI